MPKKRIEPTDAGLPSNPIELDGIKIVEPEPVKAQPVTIQELSIVDIVTAYRKAQVAAAQYVISGDEVCVMIDGALISRAPIQIIDGKPSIERTRGLAAQKAEQYCKVEILSDVANGDVHRIVTTDGRKYNVNVKAGKVL